ncbi:MAG: hypothetical protein SEPTF4163_006101 [Sporothrix epigloea]
MAPTTRQSAEKEAAAEADLSTPQGQAAASSSASPDTMAANQPNTFDALISLMTKQLEDQLKQLEMDEERREKERAQREKEREQEREADERERHDFHQQMLAAFAALSAEICAGQQVQPSTCAAEETIAPAASVTPAATVAPAATIVVAPVVPSEQADLSCSADSMAVETITLVAFPAEAACEVTGEENRETLAKTQKVDKPSVTGHSTTVKAETQAPVPTQSAQAVDAAMAVRCSVKERDFCWTILSLKPTANIPYTTHLTVMRTDWLSRPPDMRRQLPNILPTEPRVRCWLMASGAQ